MKNVHSFIRLCSFILLGVVVSHALVAIGPLAIAVMAIVWRTVFKKQSTKQKLMKTFSILLTSFLCVFAIQSIFNMLSHENPYKTSKLVLRVEPKVSYELHEIVPVYVEVEDVSTTINAIQADVSFSPSMAQVVGVSFSSSFTQVLAQQLHDDSQGVLRLVGGVIQPGFSSTKGRFATVYLEMKQSGNLPLSLLTSSMVLSHDGKGTNVMKSAHNLSVMVVPKVVPQNIHDKQLQLAQQDILNSQQRVLSVYYPLEKMTFDWNDIQTQVTQNETEKLFAKLRSWHRYTFWVWNTLFRASAKTSSNLL